MGPNKNETQVDLNGVNGVSNGRSGNLNTLHPNLHYSDRNGNPTPIANSIYVPTGASTSTSDVNDFDTGSQNGLISGERPRRTWKDYSHLEKSLWISLSFVSFLCVLLIAGTFLLKFKLDKDEEIPPITKPPVVTELPPWLTIGTSTTTTTRRTPPTSTSTQPPGYNSCVDTECTLAAAELLQAIDQTVNPCEDFYKFACGGWIKQNQIPETSPKWFQMDSMQKRLTAQIKSVLEDGEKDETEVQPEPLLMAQNFYETCMKQENINTYSRFIEFVDSLILYSKDDARNLGKIRQAMGGNYLWTLYVDLDEYDTSNNTVYIDQPEFGIPRAYLVDEEENKNVQAYQTLIKEIWTALYGDATEAEEIASSIVQFESLLANISTKPEDRRNKEDLYNPMPIRDLYELAGNDSTIVWENYFEETFLNLTAENMNGTVEEEETASPLDWSESTVIVRDIPFFSQLATVLSDSISNDPTILQNYLKWRIIFTLANDVSSDLRGFMYNFAQVTQGLQQPRPRDDVCVAQTNSIFGMSISYGYIRKYSTENGNDKANEMVTAIRQAFNETLYSPELSWLSPETRKAAEEKAVKMRARVGYPEWLLNDFPTSDNSTEEYPYNIVDYYEGLELPLPESEDPLDLHLVNVQATLEWRSIRQLKLYNQKKDVNRWNTDPTILNAYYSSVYNAITLPAGILQKPFYGMPLEYLNYGAIGSIVGHELTHGFDDRGRQNDGDGNLVGWWDEETLGNYTEQAECFVDQYSNYTVPELNIQLNGRNTLGENIADTSGVNLAFRAYKNFVQGKVPEKALPGFTNYTPEQMFFLSYAQVWCGAYTLESLETQVKSGVHSPPQYRVKGVMQNSEDFRQTWNCPSQGESQTCRIW